MSNDTDISQRQGAKRIATTISKDHMTVSIVMRKPGSNDSPITPEEIRRELEKIEVVFGIDETAIERACIDEKYNVPVRVAQGLMPRKGENSKFDYKFDTTQNHKPAEDEDGRIDYKNINFVQNVSAGEVLVVRYPATEGEPGTNVFGRPIKGQPGRTLPFKNGANTRVSDDGNTLVASASGAIQFLNGRVSVNDVMTIHGDVDFSVGNINCKASVKVSGSIKAGFEIHSEGDLEVGGSVEDALIEVDGNVMIKGGFIGNDKGHIKSGGEVYLKFAEGTRIQAEGDVVVGGELVNCRVSTNGNVVIKGRKGKIVGGEIKAKKEIRAGVLGSEAGTVTLLMVAYDRELAERHFGLIRELHRLKDDGERVKRALYGLYRAQMDGKLTAEQEAALYKLEEFQNELPTSLESLQKEKLEVEASMRTLLGARIIAEEVLHVGVRAAFGLVYRDIDEDRKRCILTMEGNRIMCSDFREDLLKKIDEEARQKKAEADAAAEAAHRAADSAAPHEAAAEAAPAGS